MIEALPRAQWRLLHHAPASGARNMAVDDAILELARKGEAPPTLRLYDWTPGTLTLGLGQPLADVDTARLAANGWGMVRRPTGGRAILHIDELTYSVIGPNDEPRLAGGVLESYRRISAALMQSLKVLGLRVEQQTGHQLPGNADLGPVCFEVPSDYEITLGGKKLIGSAQARRKGGVLQHGSLPLFGDIARITDALVYASQAEREDSAARVRQRAATAKEGLGRMPSYAEAAAAFIEGFSEMLNIDLVEGELSAEEEAAAAEWEAQRYASDAWMERA
ncbi:MAG: lipoate--protein ligase family protein [Anaerolineales bacterium]|nr:MAG: lipoate--protein ligase family protein [Anaerolineales bacterium]